MFLLGNPYRTLTDDNMEMLFRRMVYLKTLRFLDDFPKFDKWPPVKTLRYMIGEASGPTRMRTWRLPLFAQQWTKTLADGDVREIPQVNQFKLFRLY